MQEEILQVLESYKLKNRLRDIWKKIVRVMACIVVFCTTYALILPAITQESDTSCGFTEHVHTDACFGSRQQMVCTAQSLGLHTHTDACRDGAGKLICGQADYVIHSHDEKCYDNAGVLICALPERQAHTHTDGCYKLIQTVGLHTHTEECSIPVRGELICTQEEAPGHTHGDGCYERTLTCTVPEGHFHTDACWEERSGCPGGEVHIHSEQCERTVKVLVCTAAQNHSHTDGCYQRSLICAEEERAGHSHTDDCYAWSQELICTVTEEYGEPERVLVCAEPQAQVHVHDPSCFTATQNSCALPEHTHSLICYSDPNADLENTAVWNRSVASADLTGEWSHDVVAIARTQLGYVESTRNYRVLSDGTTIRGYSRYGAWYGDPYGDWCAMFVSFCLDYAGVDMPLHSNVDGWIEKLSAEALYHNPGAHVPQAGELVFFDWDGDGSSNHVGIVAELITGENGTVPQIATIEGNATNRVQQKQYALNDPTILGYASLPVQLDAEEQGEVDRVIAMINGLPTAAQIETELAAYAAADDAEGEAAYYERISRQTAKAYYYYSALNEQQKQAVTNADKLMELEFIWSVTTYEEAFVSDLPTEDDWTSTKDFVELNLYDYNGSINEWWISNENYPGFQWNGGAYSMSSNRKTNAAADMGIPNAYTERNSVISIDFGNSMITDFTYGDSSNYGKSVNAVAVTRNGGDINTIDVGDYGVTNRPTGYSVGIEAMNRTLLNGYPGLSDGKTSLGYLFGDENADTHDAVTKLNTESIDGLFLQNSISGAYSFNSREGHAQFVAEDNRFVRYQQIITPNFIVYPFGNFLPLNSITERTDATQVGTLNYVGGMQAYVEETQKNLTAANNSGVADDNQNTTRAQLITMLDEYAESWGYDDTESVWSEISATDAIADYFQVSGDKPSENIGFLTQAHLDRLYNIDWDVETNFFFGMDMKMEFMMPRDGLTGTDNGDNAAAKWLAAADGTYYLDGSPDGIPDYPMVFNFAGDDDVWVYIDGVLFLDLTGIHRHVGGRINFEKGTVEYYALDTTGTGDVSATPYQTFTFAEILDKAGRDASVLNEKGTFADYTTHTFNFYYMERGSGSSVCRINFNFPMLRQNSITVSKENATLDGGAIGDAVMGSPDYYFNIVTESDGKTELFVGPGSKTGITQYAIMDSAGSLLKDDEGNIRVFQTDQYGIFTLKAGQSAVFEGIEENKGEYFVQELIKAEDNEQYPQVYINGAESQYNALVDWSGRTYFTAGEDPTVGPYGYRWYGRSGVDTDSGSNTSFYFEQQNRLDPAKLGTLAVTKQVIGTETSSERIFHVEVKLDGVLLPAGTAYAVGEEQRTVAEAGILELKPGETAIIENIISGSEFEIRETDGSGYQITYDAPDAEEVNEITQTDGTAIRGVIRTGGTVNILVTNTEMGANIQIPVEKTFANGGAGLTHAYSFTLTQVADAAGETAVPDGTALTLELEFEGAEGGGMFTLNYLKHQLATLPATFYYRIEETGETGTALDNGQVFIVEVRVEADGTGIKAALVSVNGDAAVTEAHFINTLTAELTVGKQIHGSSEVLTQRFDFEVTLTPPEGITLPDAFTVIRTAADGTQTTETASVSGGRLAIAGLGHGETAAIQGIPVGTSWTVTETYASGFIVTWASGEAGGEGTTASGTVAPMGTQVTVTNTQTYVLPETGGSGTTAYTMAGWMLMLCSAAYLLYRSQKRRKEAA